jgi:hypothetical protein
LARRYPGFYRKNSGFTQRAKGVAALLPRKWANGRTQHRHGRLRPDSGGPLCTSCQRRSLNIPTAAGFDAAELPAATLVDSCHGLQGRQRHRVGGKLASANVAMGKKLGDADGADGENEVNEPAFIASPYCRSLSEDLGS